VRLINTDNVVANTTRRGEGKKGKDFGKTNPREPVEKVARLATNDWRSTRERRKTSILFPGAVGAGREEKETVGSEF
jgi:hypothetical protein